LVGSDWYQYFISVDVPERFSRNVDFPLQEIDIRQKINDWKEEKKSEPVTFFFDSLLSARVRKRWYMEVNSRDLHFNLFISYV